MKYVKMGMEFDCLQWTGKNLDEVIEFCTPDKVAHQEPLKIKSETPGEDGFEELDVNDWIIKKDGKLWVDDPTIFGMAFRPVSE